MFVPENYTDRGLKVHINKRKQQIANMKKELGISSTPTHQDRWNAICNSVRLLNVN
jgi:hypothetical protein